MDRNNYNKTSNNNSNDMNNSKNSNSNNRNNPSSINCNNNNNNNNANDNSNQHYYDNSDIMIINYDKSNNRFTVIVLHVEGFKIFVYYVSISFC